ncbi:MAG: ATP-binding protein [bacterium]
MPLSEKDFIQLKDLAKDEESYDKIVGIITEFLRDSNNKTIDRLLNHSEDFFWMKISADNKVNHYSDSIKNITGYTIDEINEMPAKLLSIVHDEDLINVRKVLTELENDKSKSPMSFTYRIKNKNGQIIWVKEKIRTEKKSGITEFTSVVWNINNFREAEDKLRTENDRLVELNKAKDRFISIVSHDLRAPFTSLLGFSEILLNEHDLPDEEKNEYLEYIYDAAKTQLQLINYLLDWSRLQTGRIQIDPKRLNVKTLVSNCVSTLTGSAIRKNIEIKPNLPPDLFVNADERLLSQAITNLISNSIKFTPAGKRVFVSANKFKEGMLELVVKDEGIGISEENQTKMFKIDQKFSLEGTDGEKGSGLGLTLVKEIIEKHSGAIWFYSKLNEGSEFHIIIPEAKNIILIVEDEAELRDLYRMIIEKSLTGFEIMHAENGYEAMSIILNTAMPSVIITDHIMPLMNGTQLVEAIRRRDPHGYIPIIVASANLEEEIVKKYNSMGVDTLLKKPFDYKELSAALEKCVL